jgi:hypothetical protein
MLFERSIPQEWECGSCSHKLAMTLQLLNNMISMTMRQVLVSHCFVQTSSKILQERECGSQPQVKSAMMLQLLNEQCDIQLGNDAATAQCEA